MLCKDVMEQIEKKFAPEYACGWDNVGLLAGRYDREVKSIYIALDATDDVVDYCVDHEIDMLLTHHPLIFQGMKRITDQDFIGRRILKLISNDISYYAMHTNYDVMGMADLSVKLLGWDDTEVLEETGVDVFENPVGIGKVASLEMVCSLFDVCEQVKWAFELDHVKVFGDLNKEIKKAAICPGSGKSVITEALKKGADVLITGDIGHHEGIDAVACGMAIIDAGHYGVEHIFQKDMEEYLKETLTGVDVLTAPICHPFVIV